MQFMPVTISLFLGDDCRRQQWCLFEETDNKRPQFRLTAPRQVSLGDLIIGGFPGQREHRGVNDSGIAPFPLPEACREIEPIAEFPGPDQKDSRISLI
jgi:hypothetical protein